MPNIVEITDIRAPELDVYARLTEAQLRSRRAPDKGMFIAESAKVISCALKAGCVPVSFLMERRQLEGQGRELLERCGDVPVFTADRAVLEQLTGYQLHRGVLCAMRRPAPIAAADVCQGARRVVVLENIVDPTNLGAIFRSAAALGMDGVLLTPSCCDPLHRRAARVSMGTVFQVPWAYLGAVPADWPEEGLAFLREQGFTTAAMALSDRAVSIEEPRLRGIGKLALVLGTEGDGLAEKTVAMCDETVCIPMAHGVDSLNVAAAGAVAFWVLRRRDVP